MYNTQAGGSSAQSIVSFIVFVVWYILCSLFMMKIANKKGLSGILAWIPIANLVVILQIAGKPVWWVILLLIPVVNIIVGIIVLIPFYKAINKSPAWIIAWLFYPLTVIPLWKASKE